MILIINVIIQLFDELRLNPFIFITMIVNIHDPKFITLNEN